MAPSCKAKAGPCPGMLVTDKGLERYADEISRSLAYALQEHGDGSGWSSKPHHGTDTSAHQVQGVASQAYAAQVQGHPSHGGTAQGVQPQLQAAQVQGHPSHGDTAGVQSPAQIQSPSHHGAPQGVQCPAQSPGHSMHGGTPGVHATAQAQGHAAQVEANRMTQAQDGQGQGGMEVKTEPSYWEAGHESAGGYDSAGTWWEKNAEVEGLWWYYRPGKSWGRWMDKTVPLIKP